MKSRTIFLTLSVALLILGSIQIIQALSRYSLWDEQGTDFFQKRTIGSAPPELDWGIGYGLMTTRHYENSDSDFVYSGAISCQHDHSFRELGYQYDWSGIEIFIYDEITFEIIPWDLNYDVSVWVYGQNSGSGFLMLLETLDHVSWDLLGRSYALANTNDTFTGWRRITFSLEDFQAYPGDSAADYNDVGIICTLINKQDYLEGDDYYFDLWETAATAQQSVSSDFNDAVGVIALMMAVVIMINLIYVIDTGSVDILKQIIISMIVLMFILLLLGVHLLSL